MEYTRDSIDCFSSGNIASFVNRNSTIDVERIKIISKHQIDIWESIHHYWLPMRRFPIIDYSTTQNYTWRHYSEIVASIFEYDEAKKEMDVSFWIYFYKDILTMEMIIKPILYFRNAEDKTYFILKYE